MWLLKRDKLYVSIRVSSIDLLYSSHFSPFSSPLLSSPLLSSLLFFLSSSLCLLSWPPISVPLLSTVCLFMCVRMRESMFQSMFCVCNMTVEFWCSFFFVCFTEWSSHAAQPEHTNDWGRFDWLWRRFSFSSCQKCLKYYEIIIFDTKVILYARKDLHSNRV